MPFIQSLLLGYSNFESAQEQLRSHFSGAKVWTQTLPAVYPADTISKKPSPSRSAMAIVPEVVSPEKIRIHRIIHPFSLTFINFTDFHQFYRRSSISLTFINITEFHCFHHFHQLSSTFNYFHRFSLIFIDFHSSQCLYCRSPKQYLQVYQGNLPSFSSVG